MALKKIVLCVTLILLVEGCTPLDLIKTAVPSLTQKPLVAVDVGDKSIKGAGTDQKVHTNNGQIVGGNVINIPKENTAPIHITQVSWFTLFETIMLIVLTITTTVGWLKPVMEWLSKMEKKH